MNKFKILITDQSLLPHQAKLLSGFIVEADGRERSQHERFGVTGTKNNILFAA